MIATEPAVGVPARERPAKIQDHHLDRLAVVYVRQSTARQVLEHRESTALQYALRERAIAWGWPASRVLLIDEDLGQSGASVEGRAGFQRLLAEVSLDHVGLVLGIEMSRLARSCRDWHQLLELCALFGTLLSDQDGLYDPRQYNDRLLLGLKGTLSEAELHVLRQRMYEGQLNKARRGELFNHAPIGYVRTPAGDLIMDPDQQVQQVVRLVFEQFERRGTINAVLCHLVRHQIKMPVRVHAGAERGRLEWREPNRQTVHNLLRHPIYAGAYSWGRRPVDPRKKVPGRPGTGRTVALPEDCQVLIRDRCPAYITWEQHQANRRQMAENRDRAKARGPMREGAALLSGLVVCGRCGHRMTVHYTSRCEPRYACIRDVVDYGGPRCQSLAGKPLEQLLAQQVLTVLEPAALELSLQAAAAIEQDRASVDRHWRLRLERAGHDVDRAARQYHRVEPENRLVARELEAQWERELQAQQALQEQYERHRRQQAPDLSDAQRQEIRDLSRDIPTLWRSSRTTVGDRQAIVRLLVERITVGAPQDSNHADVTIHWAGGFASQHRMRRPVARYEQLDDYAQLSQRVLELHDQQRTAPQIAEQLNREGFRPPKRRDTYNGGMVGTLIRRMRPVTPSLRPAAALNADEWYLNDLADHLSMRPHTLYRWMCRGWVHARKHPANGRWVLWADPDELDRLRRLKTAPRTWHNQLQAAHLTQPKARPDGSEKAGCPGGFASAGGAGDSANP